MKDIFTFSHHRTFIKSIVSSFVTVMSAPVDEKEFHASLQKRHNPFLPGVKQTVEGRVRLAG